MRVINNKLDNYWRDILFENSYIIYSTITIENNTGSGNRPIYYIANKKDATIDLSGKEIPSQIIFANITNCTIKNVVCRDGSGIELVAVSNSVLDNITSFNNYHGLRMADDATHDNIIKNSAFFNNSHNGIEAWGGNNTTITNCYFANNGEYGIQLGNNNYIIYLNNFLNNRKGSINGLTSTNVILQSSKPINYTYNGKNYTNYLGNYYSDYNGTDSDGDGIGDAPYIINISEYGTTIFYAYDNYPLIKPVENYIINRAAQTNNTTTNNTLKIIAVYNTSIKNGKYFLTEGQIINVGDNYSLKPIHILRKDNTIYKVDLQILSLNGSVLDEQFNITPFDLTYKDLKVCIEDAYIDPSDNNGYVKIEILNTTSGKIIYDGILKEEDPYIVGDYAINIKCVLTEEFESKVNFSEVIGNISDIMILHNGQVVGEKWDRVPFNFTYNDLKVEVLSVWRSLNYAHAYVELKIINNTNGSVLYSGIIKEGNCTSLIGDNYTILNKKVLFELDTNKEEYFAKLNVSQDNKTVISINRIPLNISYTNLTVDIPAVYEDINGTYYVHMIIEDNGRVVWDTLDKEGDVVCLPEDKNVSLLHVLKKEDGDYIVHGSIQHNGNVEMSFNDECSSSNIGNNFICDFPDSGFEVILHNDLYTNSTGDRFINVTIINTTTNETIYSGLISEGSILNIGNSTYALNISNIFKIDNDHKYMVGMEIYFENSTLLTAYKYVPFNITYGPLNVNVNKVLLDKGNTYLDVNVSKNIQNIILASVGNINISIIPLNETPINITFPLINTTLNNVLNKLNTSVVDHVLPVASEIKIEDVKDTDTAEELAEKIINNIYPIIAEGFAISNKSEDVKEIKEGDETLILTNITMNVSNTTSKGFITLIVPIGDINNISITVDGKKLNEFGNDVNTSLGWYIYKDGILEITLVKDPTISITFATAITSSSTTTSSTTTSYYSGGGGYVSSNIANDIKSPVIKAFVKKAKLMVGSSVDANLSAKELKDTYDLINKPLEITDDAILVGGPVANPLTKKYMDKFPVKITNGYPGKNRGVIEAITLRVKVDENIYRDVTVVLLAGSDRWGTKAAVEYFKQLDDIPKEPIFVEWKDGKAVKIEKP
ncbi:MAG: hypothetical protein GXN95_05015 [Methanococci archaeon]|nr:hypothetical protein [Methanococci archaeon]